MLRQVVVNFISGIVRISVFIYQANLCCIVHLY